MVILLLLINLVMPFQYFFFNRMLVLFVIINDFYNHILNVFDLLGMFFAELLQQFISQILPLTGCPLLVTEKLIFKFSHLFIKLFSQQAILLK